MRKSPAFTAIFSILFTLIFSTVSTVSASAHQPVILTKSDTSAAKGPLLVDGTISFAVRASFAKAKEVRAFRAQLKVGESLQVQYLIIDKAPESKLKVSQFPSLVITSPSGVRQTLKLNERTKFFEPYSQTRYLYLGRISQPAESGIYSFTLTSKVQSAITIGIGDREVPGEVMRGDVVLPKASASPSPSPSPSASASAAASASPAPSPETSKAGISLADVGRNNSAASCWSIIDGNVYDLTRWINSHPGGASAIRSLCGVDGSASFAAQHYGQSKPVARLTSYLLGAVAK